MVLPFVVMHIMGRNKGGQHSLNIRLNTLVQLLHSFLHSDFFCILAALIQHVTHENSQCRDEQRRDSKAFLNMLLFP